MNPFRQITLIRRKYNSYGGAERFLERLTKQLVERDVEVTLITENWPQSKSSTAKVVEVNLKSISRVSRLVEFNEKITSILKASSFQIVQTHERLLGADIFRLGDGIHAAWINRSTLNKSAVRKWWSKLDPYNQTIIEIEKQMAKEPRLLYVANSQLVADELRTYYDVLADRIRVIKNGIDISFFRPATANERQDARSKLGVPIDAPTFCFIGSGFRRKGLWLVVDAIRRSPDYALVIAGKDKESDELRSYIVKNRLENRIFFLGPHNNVRELLWASDVFLLPSTYDPSSNAVIEAIACGLPAIVSGGVGNAFELVSHTAGVVIGLDSEALKEKMEWVIQPKRYSEFSQNARRLGEEFDEQVIVREWLSLYSHVTERKS